MRNSKAENAPTVAGASIKRTRKRGYNGPIKPGQPLLFKPQVLELLGNPSYSTVWGWMRDGQFPLAVALGPPNGKSTLIAWHADEIYEWIAALPRRQLGRATREFERIDLAEHQPAPPKLFDTVKQGVAEGMESAAGKIGALKQSD